MDRLVSQTGFLIALCVMAATASGLAVEYLADAPVEPPAVLMTSAILWFPAFASLLVGVRNFSAFNAVAYALALVTFVFDPSKGPIALVMYAPYVTLCGAVTLIFVGSRLIGRIKRHFPP
jgi:hypothetical protein